MILLDTNVISELVRPQPDAGVLAWLDAQDAQAIATSAIATAELLHGIARLPAGRRRTRLSAAIGELIEDDLGGRVHPFDWAAAKHYAIVVSNRERAGHPIATADAQIAAICRAHSATLATRNTKDFHATGVELIDPWQQ